MMMGGFVERVISNPQTRCRSAKQVGLQMSSERQRERVAVRRAAGILFQMTGPATAKLIIPSCPVSSVTPFWVRARNSLKWKYAVFCTVARVHFLVESAPHSRNLHIEFHFFRSDTPDRTPTAGGGDHVPHPPTTPVLAVRWGKRPHAETQTVML